MQTAAYSSLVVRWKPVGQNDSQVVADAYCVLELADRAAAALLARKVSAASVTQLGSTGRMHILARTDARGVLMTVPQHSAGAPDPLSLQALAPLLFPLGITLKVWWTQSRKVFDDVLQLEQGVRDSQHPLQFAHSIALAFDEHVEFPAAVDAALLELDNGPELRALLQRRKDDAFPAQLLELAPDGRTWCVELRDHALEIAVDAALCIQQAAGLGKEHQLPAHQLLLAEVLDILRRRGQEAGPFNDIIPKHEHLCGGEYRALRDDLRYAVARMTREVEKAGEVLSAVLERALHELSAHPYPEGDYERREHGPISRRTTASLLLNSQAVPLQDALVERFAKHGVGEEERLLAIARGEQDPADATNIEQFLAQTAAVLAWLSKASSFVQKGVELGQVVTDPKDVVALTSWVEAVLAAAAQRKKVGKQQLFDAVTRGMRLVQVWSQLKPDFEFEAVRVRLEPNGMPVPQYVAFTKIAAGRWHGRFERASSLIKLLNVVALGGALFAKNGEKPSVLKTMTDLHGFVDGLDGTYRILSDTAQTQLGTSLKSLGKLLGPVAVVVAAEDAWSQFQTGDAVGSLLATGGVGLTFLSATLDLVVASPHPAVKIAIAAAGLALGAAAVLTTDKEEQFLEQYRPLCERAGAYLEARTAVAAIEHVLEDVEWTSHKNRALATRLAE